MKIKITLSNIEDKKLLTIIVILSLIVLGFTLYSIGLLEYFTAWVLFLLKISFLLTTDKKIIITKTA